MPNCTQRYCGCRNTEQLRSKDSIFCSGAILTMSIGIAVVGWKMRPGSFVNLLSLFLRNPTLDALFINEAGAATRKTCQTEPRDDYTNDSPYGTVLGENTYVYETIPIPGNLCLASCIHAVSGSNFAFSVETEPIVALELYRGEGYSLLWPHELAVFSKT